MKVIVCTKGEGLSLQEREAPGPLPPGYVKLDVRYVGISRTDRRIAAGTHPHAQECLIPGHEISGTVAEAGDGVDLRIGTPVAVNPYLPCWTCHACEEGRTNCCTNLNVLGVHTDGGLAEQIVVPAINVYSASRLDLKTAAMIEVLAVGVHAVRHAQSFTCSLSHTLVIGCGAVGLSIAMCLTDNKYPVTAMDIRREPVETAKTKFGIEPAIVANGALADKHTAHGEYHLIFDATGCAASVSNAFNKLLANGGILVSLGIMTEDLQLDPTEASRREKTLTFSRNSTHQDFIEAMKLAHKYPHTLGTLIANVTTMDDAAADITHPANDNSGIFKLVVQIQPESDPGHNA